MTRFSIRDVLWLTVVAVATGCGGKSCCVIQAMYEMGVNPVFWAEQAQAV